MCICLNADLNISPLCSSGSFWADLLDKDSLCTPSHASDVQDVWNVRLSNLNEFKQSLSALRLCRCSLQAKDYLMVKVIPLEMSWWCLFCRLNEAELIALLCFLYVAFLNIASANTVALRCGPEQNPAW